MSIFDRMKSTAQQAVTAAAQSIGNKRETFTFQSLPESLAEMKSCPKPNWKPLFRQPPLRFLPSAPIRQIGTSAPKCSIGYAVLVP